MDTDKEVDLGLTWFTKRTVRRMERDGWECLCGDPVAARDDHNDTYLCMRCADMLVKAAAILIIAGEEGG